MFYINNMTQMSCNFKEQSKIDGNPSYPPPPVWRLDLAPSHVEKRQVESPKRPNGPPFACLFLWRQCVFLILSLLRCQSSPISFLHAVMRENMAYIVNRDYKKAPNLVASQSATLHSTGNISAEDSVHKNKVGQNQCCGSGMFIPDPGSDFFPSRIPDPNCLHPGSQIRIKEFKYFNPKKMVSKL
jgi:hypothetical protein